MKGVIFNVVEEVVTDLYDRDTWDDLLDAAEADGAYTALGNYADAELVLIAEVAAAATGMAIDDLWRTVGRLALPKLAARLPDSMGAGTDALSFLCDVNDIIHPQVRALYPEAVPPVFEFEHREDGDLAVRYRSERELVPLAEGLMLGCGDQFDQPLEVELVNHDAGSGTADFLVRRAPES